MKRLFLFIIRDIPLACIVYVLDVFHQTKLIEKIVEKFYD